MAKEQTPDQLDAEFRQLELEEKRERVAQMKAEREERESLRERNRLKREQLVSDIKKADEERIKRQRVCRHKKGGRNNNFAQGNASNYSVVVNTYPTGIVEIRCTRCGDCASRPDKAYRRELKKLYPNASDFKTAWDANAEKWKIWSQFSTDNEPSGGQIFLVEETTAA